MPLLVLFVFIMSLAPLCLRDGLYSSTPRDHLPQRTLLSVRLGGTSRGSSTVWTTNRSASGGNVTAGGGRRQRSVVNSIALLRPRGLLDPLRVLPWAGIAQLAATRAVTRTTEGLWQVLGRDLCEQLFLVSGAQDVDLGASDGVEELLDNAEDAGEAPGCVDNVHLAEALGVVVLRDGGDGLQVAVDGGCLGDTDALQVEDGARSLEEVAGLARAGGQTGVGHLFVLADEVLNHALLAGDLAEGSQVDVAELLDVYGATILQRTLAKYKTCY